MFNSFIPFSSNLYLYILKDKKINGFIAKFVKFITIIVIYFIAIIRWKVPPPSNNEEFKKYNYDKTKGVLFISNHSSNMDGHLIYLILMRLGYVINIWSHDFVFDLPFIGKGISTIGHVKVPNVPARRNSTDSEEVKKAIHSTLEGLKEGKHYLIFPSGSSKKTGLEKIRGKSAIHQILKEMPDANVVLIRHRGMWGSRFSWAAKRNPNWKSETHRWFTFIGDAILMFFLNLVFFVPKREFRSELTPAPSDFPRFGTRKEINHWLENYYNEDIPKDGEIVNAVNNYFWKNDCIEYECVVKDYAYDSTLIQESVKTEIKQIVAAKCGKSESELQQHDDLSCDLGLDSLEITEILMEIEKKYDLPVQIPGRVSTLEHLMAISSKIPIESIKKYIPLRVLNQRDIKENVTSLQTFP